MRIQTKIKKWGNSLGLRLSGPMKSIPHFEEDMMVDVEVTEKGLTIHPCESKQYLSFSEKQLLKNLDAKTAHADELATLSSKELEN